MQCGVQGPKVVGHRATKVCIMLDGRALASVRVARGLESVLGVGSEFVVLVLSVVRHVDINLTHRTISFIIRDLLIAISL